MLRFLQWLVSLQWPLRLVGFLFGGFNPWLEETRRDPVPAYRRRGHAVAIMRSLLDDALAFGATACVLASTAMAHGLYLRFGFRDAMPMVEFQTRKG